VGGLETAWLAGTAIVAWREVHRSHRLPVAGALIGVTALFAVLSVLAAAAPPAKPVIIAGAWGLNVAGLLQVLPAGLYGQVQQAQSAEAAAQGETPAQAPAGGVMNV
jgi:hypothetical protein